jgi:hypothetical protein
LQLAAGAGMNGRHVAILGLRVTSVFMDTEGAGNSRQVTTEELMAAAGQVITPEGRARARRRLDEARATWPPERWEALRRQIGRPAKRNAA